MKNEVIQMEMIGIYDFVFFIFVVEEIIKEKNMVC